MKASSNGGGYGGRLGFGAPGQRVGEGTAESELKRPQKQAGVIGWISTLWLVCLVFWWPVLIGHAMAYLALVLAGVTLVLWATRFIEQFTGAEWRGYVLFGVTMSLALWWVLAGGDWFAALLLAYWWPLAWEIGGGKMWVIYWGGSFALPGWWLAVRLLLALLPGAWLYPSALVVWRFTFEVVLPQALNTTFKPATPASIPLIGLRETEAPPTNDGGPLLRFMAWLLPRRTSTTTVSQEVSSLDLRLAELRALYEHYSQREGTARKIGDGVTIPGITQARLREIRDALLAFEIPLEDGTTATGATRANPRAAAFVTDEWLAWAEAELAERDGWG